MRSFGKTMRNALPALGLGLIGALGLAGVTAITAPAAYAQGPSEAFVNAYNAAKEAFGKSQFAQAATLFEKAATEAKSKNEREACAIGRVQSYQYAKNYAKVIEAIEAHRAMGGNDPGYDRTLIDAYERTNQQAKATELAKKIVARGSKDPIIYGYVASNALKARNYADALTFGQQAIDLSKGKPPRDYYNIMLKAYLDQKKMNEYYALLEKVAPVLNHSDYWGPFIKAARNQPKYKDQSYALDVYRAFTAVNVKLTDAELAQMGEAAYNRGVAIEADKVLTPLAKDGRFGGAGDPKGVRNKGLFETIQKDAKADKAGQLAKDEAEAANKPTGSAYVSVGESYMINGDYAKAIDNFQKGLAKGSLEAGEVDYVKLRMGMAQLKAGKKDDARKTWSEVKSDNGSGWLARVWTAISKI